MTKDINYSQYTLDELKKIRSQVDKEITNFESKRRQEAIAAAQEAAKSHGFNLNDLMGNAPVKKQRAPSEAKYVHPENPETTWTGRGRQPAWIREGLESGKALADFAI